MLEQGLSLLEPEGQMGGLKHTTQKQKTLEVLASGAPGCAGLSAARPGTAAVGLLHCCGRAGRGARLARAAAWPATIPAAVPGWSNIGGFCILVFLLKKEGFVDALRCLQ
ncbi:hypothetical protein Y1Q_0023359 [Alligator mississippiensis]|uniref:Uncharacterized protein n=1 Tax=Alligator mississippiensis TaxID=8496 RepID=A0A151NPD9_ALLMI|nr:hypothetical protein Y1Q_0023359 [Alligator mississippiensis]